MKTSNIIFQNIYSNCLLLLLHYMLIQYIAYKAFSPKDQTRLASDMINVILAVGPLDHITLII